MSRHRGRVARAWLPSCLLLANACHDKSPPPPAAPAVIAVADAARSPLDAALVDVRAELALPLSRHATADHAGGIAVYLSTQRLRIDDEMVSLDGFNDPDHLVRLTFLGDRSLASLGFAPVITIAKRRFGATGSQEVTIYADSAIPYLALGQILTSLVLAGAKTLHLAVRVDGGDRRTFDFAAREVPPDDAAGVPVATVLTTFVRVKSKALTCEARPIRDPFDMKELAACAAAVARAAPRDELVVVPGMSETTGTLVGMLDALAPSFPKLALVVDGDILRGRGPKEDLDRVERDKHTTPRANK